MVVMRLCSSARGNIPESVYIAFKSVARITRSSKSSAPIKILKTANERKSIPNRLRRSGGFTEILGRFLATRGLPGFAGGAVREGFRPVGSGFFTRQSSDDNERHAKNKIRCGREHLNF